MTANSTKLVAAEPADQTAGPDRSPEMFQVSDSRYRRLFETARDGVLLLNAETAQIEDVNPYLIEMLGYSHDEFLGKKLWEVGAFADVAESKEMFSRLQTEGYVRYEDMPLRSVSGKTVEVEFVSNSFDCDGVKVIQCNIRDITERRATEEALLDAGALQNAIFNSANFSSIATDAKGVIQIFNVGAERMLGYLAADVIDKITPADISDPQEVIARARKLSRELDRTIAPGFEALAFKASRGIEDIYELTYIRKDGSRFPAVVSVTALRDAQGRIIGYLLIGTDNTARKEIESEQRQLGQRLRDHQFYTRSLFESNIDALMTTDPSGIITDVNKQMEALTGSTREELIGAPFKNFFTDRERAEAGIDLVLSEHTVTNYELMARARDGKETMVSCNAATLYDRDRKLLGVFVAARDITERKVAEEKIHHLASHDSLTQLPNRRLLEDRLLQTMASSKRSGRYGALMFLDLDKFKPINDLYGHNVGDQLLVEQSRRIAACMREVDTVARFGGDEFVVILGELDTDKAESMVRSGIAAEKLRAALAKSFTLKFTPEGKPEMNIEHRCSSSIGVALFLGQEIGMDEIIKRADTAMYKSKEAGGDTVSFFAD